MKMSKFTQKLQFLFVTYPLSLGHFGYKVIWFTNQTILVNLVSISWAHPDEALKVPRASKTQTWNVIQAYGLSASLPFLVCKPFSLMCFKMFIYHKSKVFHSNDTKMHSTWLREVHKLSCPFPQQEPRVMGSCLPSVRGGHSTLRAVWLHCPHPYPPCGKRTSQSHGEGSNGWTVFFSRGNGSFRTWNHTLCHR